MRSICHIFWSSFHTFTGAKWAWKSRLSFAPESRVCSPLKPCNLISPAARLPTVMQLSPHCVVLYKVAHRESHFHFCEELSTCGNHKYFSFPGSPPGSPVLRPRFLCSVLLCVAINNPPHPVVSIFRSMSMAIFALLNGRWQSYSCQRSG
jgi:hypothetical protein